MHGLVNLDLTIVQIVIIVEKNSFYLKKMVIYTHV